MAIACPKCGRPNAESAARCMYCSASLEGAAKIEVSDETKKMVERFLAERSRKTEGENERSPGRPIQKKRAETASPEESAFKVIRGGKTSAPPAGEGWFMVVLSPVSAGEGDFAEKVAETLEADTYLVRNKLASNTPWIARRFREAEPARRLVTALLAIGAEAYSITSGQLNEIPSPMKAGKVSLVRGGLQFEGDKGDEPVVLRWGDVFLIVRGRIRRKVVGNEVRKRKKQAPSGLPEELKEYEILDIFPKEGRGVRIGEGVTDFSGLGKYMRPSSLLNLRWVTKGFEMASKPIMDDGYRHLDMVFRSPARSVVQIIRKKEDEVSYLDNSRHFDEYSKLVQLHYKKLSGGS